MFLPLLFLQPSQAPLDYVLYISSLLIVYNDMTAYLCQRVGTTSNTSDNHLHMATEQPDTSGMRMRLLNMEIKSYFSQTQLFVCMDSASLCPGAS